MAQHPKTQQEPARDPQQDHLLTPENCVVALIDYQPEQYSTVTSASRERIDLNVIALAKIAHAYDLPVVLSTVGGISPVAHDRAFDRMIAAGASPVTTISFGGELMRNWARPDADNLRNVMQWYFPRKQQLDQAEGVDGRG